MRQEHIENKFPSLLAIPPAAKVFEKEEDQISFVNIIPQTQVHIFFPSKSSKKNLLKSLKNFVKLQQIEFY